MAEISEDFEDLILECDSDDEEYDSSTDSEVDHGEIGEFDDSDSEEESDDVDGAAEAARAVLPYQDEPLPQNPAVAGREGDNGAGDGDEIDHERRLDPANVVDW